MNQRPISIAVALPVAVISLYAALIARGEVQRVLLPSDYADFAMHPTSGDIIALDAENSQAVLFRASDLKMKRSEPAAKLRVGSTPVSVFYKEFEDKQVFAVVCSQDTHMYLIDALKFALLAKVELNQSGVSYVTGSRNATDPFIYYNYGSGHDSAAAAVSLRDMKNKGLAFDDAMDCAISASGEIAYRRGPWSPSGFESLIRTTDLSADKPAFARLFYDHNSTAQYLPDPFDRFTAAGSKIFVRSLEKSVASLDFVPHDFFTDRPVVVGIEGGDRFRQAPAGNLVGHAAGRVLQHLQQYRRSSETDHGGRRRRWGPASRRSLAGRF